MLSCVRNMSDANPLGRIVEEITTGATGNFLFQLIGRFFQFLSRVTGRKRRRRPQQQELITWTGRQELGWFGKYQIYYPASFADNPHLTLDSNYLSSMSNLTQRPDGFSFEISGSLGGRLSVLEWTAVGRKGPPRGSAGAAS